MLKSIESSIKDENAIKTAISRAFPTTKDFIRFRDHDKTVSIKAIPKLISFTAGLGLLSAANEAAFIQYIAAITALPVQTHVPIAISFEKVIKEIKGDRSVNQLIKELNHLSQLFGMPTFNAPMFSRLKKDFKPDTAKKRSLLRILAFWIGLVQPEYIWDYASLLKIPTMEAAALPDNASEGARIDFSFQTRGEIINVEMIEWLKTIIPECIRELRLYHLIGRELQFYSATSVSLEIPKKSGPCSEPHLFGQAVRDCLALAHQVVLRWTLQSVRNDESTISVAMAAGEFHKLSFPLQTILSTNFRDGATIRMTEFTKICIHSTDVKVVLAADPTQIRLPNGNYLPVWSVRYFWPGYYDLAPDLLNNDVFPNTLTECARFQEHLFHSESLADNKSIPSALAALRRFPEKDLLGVEIAKICLSKRMFHEANAILAIVLAADPLHVIARQLRMIVFMNLAIGQEDRARFDAFFDRAADESVVILEQNIRDEEIFVEIGLLYFGRAAYTLAGIRKQPRYQNISPVAAADLKPVIERLLQPVITDFQTALSFMRKGLTYSPTGNRSIFWIAHLRALMRILKKADASLVSNAYPIRDSDDSYPDVCLNLFFSMGWLNADYFTSNDEARKAECLMALFQSTVQSIDTYYDSMHFRACRPNIAYAIASVLWDLSPMLTIGIAKEALGWLTKARDTAEILIHQGVGVYGIKSYYMQIQTPEHFIQCVDRAITAIQTIIGPDMNKDALYLLTADRVNGLKLFTMHLDIDIPSGLISAPGRRECPNQHMT